MYSLFNLHGARESDKLRARRTIFRACRSRAPSILLLGWPCREDDEEVLRCQEFDVYRVTSGRAGIRLVLLAFLLAITVGVAPSMGQDDPDSCATWCAQGGPQNDANAMCRSEAQTTCAFECGGSPAYSFAVVDSCGWNAAGQFCDWDETCYFDCECI
jgi:hypothetical protein